MGGVVTSAAGDPVRVGRELGRGGEGAVFELADNPKLVAKIYHSSPSAERAEKLVAMARGSTPALRAMSAWPVDTVHDATTRVVRGFIMPRVARQKDIHHVYGPKTRLRDYPDATYRFLVRVATNVARAFAVVHQHGHVIGDVNQGGVCVSPQGTVTLVDCDSFQIGAVHRRFACDVGVLIYQPPELHSVRSFRGLPRTANHDNFGLAVLIFQTLFLARHPYAGAFRGDGEMPIERAIREYRFAYARDAARRQMRQPPGSLGLAVVPKEVAQLFERAFLEGGATGSRPAAVEWVRALGAFEADLRDCSRNSSHAFPPHLNQCALCELEGRVGVLLFIPQRPKGSGGTPAADLEEVWASIRAAISSVRFPGESEAALPLPPAPKAVEDFRRIRNQARGVLGGGIAVAFALATVWSAAVLILVPAVVVLALAIRGRAPAEARHLRKRLRHAQKRVAGVMARVESERASSSLPELERRATALHQRLKEAPARRAARLRGFEVERHQMQLQRFLDSFEVKDSKLPRFGPGLFATLISNGIETAADVTIERLSGVSGFGPKRVSVLLAWRRQIEARFRFSPNDPADARERMRIEQELHAEDARAMAELVQTASQIKGQTAKWEPRVAALRAELKAAAEEVSALRAIGVALGEAA